MYNNTDRTLDPVFSRFRGFSLSQRSMRVTSSGFCLWVIVNGKPLNLEKTTFSVLSVLLYIYNPILDIETIKGTN